MLTASILRKKRDDRELDEAEIRFLIEGFSRGEVTDEQLSAFAMAACIRGLSAAETRSLTLAMHASGDTLTAAGDRPRVDKHSTGGIGDKISLILAPLLACCDVDVPMVSGRGLGITGGTLDKLESVPGLQTSLSESQAASVLRDVHAFIIGANDSIAPADRRLYAIRDVTGTVESVGLITASILSKKLAANLDALVMDVKVGSGAFMKDERAARQLADSITRIGCDSGLPTTAILSDMDQPLGHAVGNALELNEAMAVLRGDGPPDVRSLAIELSADLLVRVNVESDADAARRRLESKIDDGTAMERWMRMIHAQGGTLSGDLPVHPETVVPAPRDGFIRAIDGAELGEVVIGLGGGRRKQGDRIDHAGGLHVHAKIGDPVEKGQPLISIFTPPASSIDYVQRCVRAFHLSSSPVPSRTTVLCHV